MFKPNPAFGSLPEGISLISMCPICNTKYNPVQVKILEERDDAHLIFIVCKNCGSGVVAVVMNGGFGVTSLGLITDLSADDILKFKDVDEIGTDDVLELHKFLESKKTNYLKLFIE